ncbi:MAG: LamG-like jellyroll fold domain-containing protein [Roseateles sp.]
MTKSCLRCIADCGAGAVLRNAHAAARAFGRAGACVATAYTCALHWKGTGDARYADKAVQIMNAWSSTLTLIAGGTEAWLAAGIQGYQFANVGEIMRTYDGLKPADLLAFQSMMKRVFYRINHGFLSNHNGTPISHYWANWALCNIASLIAIGVLCDDKDIFDEGVNYFKAGPGNGAIAQAVYYMHPGKLGQWQESGRDLMLTLRSKSGLLRFAIAVDGTYAEQFVESSAALPIGRWVHLAVTLSGQTATLYVDGLAVGVNADMALTPAQVGPAPTNWIGRSQFVSDPRLHGRVDDFRIWRSALDDAAVAALAAA